MLKIKNLRAGYDRNNILHNINLEVNDNEILALIGPNGSGKTTLLKSIFNLCDIHSGKIIFEGKDITAMPTHKLIYSGISFVLQGRQVFSDLTVKENLEMGAFSLKNKKDLKFKLAEVFDEFPILKEKKNEYAFNLSGGQQHMLVIARALMQNPKMLLIDEPSLGLAPKVAKDVFEKIKELNKRGISILLVEQKVKEAIELADRTCILDNGKIVLEGGKEILKNKKIRDIYIGTASKIKNCE
jgi:branched-chain amino acid transport system ATP-binding protein